jgi:PhnB protein
MRRNDEDEIRGVLADFTKALRNRDAAGMIAPLTEDAVLFDLAPPLRLGPAVTHDPGRLELWFSSWESPIVSEPRNLTIEVGGDVACAYGLQHMTGTKQGGQSVDLWFRATACFRRESGAWRIAHMHNSVPFAMDGSDKALLDLQP